jgi:DNA-binding transcriptional regulator LsrR (DeoR family)
MSPRKPAFALAEIRAAVARLHLELTVLFHTSLFPLNQTPPKLDANLTAVAVAVMLAHAEGHPMTEAELVASLPMSRSSIQRRLSALIKLGIITRVVDRYYLDPGRARDVPYRDQFELALAKAFAVIGAHLAKTDDDDDDDDV